MRNLFGITFSKKIPFVHIKKENIFSLLFIFMVTGVLGFILESSVYLVLYRQIIDCGFLIGPFIPIYATSVIIVLLFLRFPKPNVKNFFIIALIIAVAATVIEFVVGNLFELTTGAVLWSYIETMPLTYKYISIPISICWGLLGSFYFFVVIPFLKNIADKISKKLQIVICVIFLTIFLSDITASITLMIINGGYKELYRVQELPSIDYDYLLLLVGLLVYFILQNILCFIELKIFGIKKPLSTIIFISAYIIFALIPLFSFYDYFIPFKNNALKNMAVSGFFILTFYIYYVLSYFVLLFVNFVYKKTKKIKGKTERHISLFINRTAIIASIIMCVYGFLATKIPAVTKIDIGSGDNTIKIVAISDIHYGGTGSTVNLAKVVDNLNNQNPDVVVLVGDVFDNEISNIDTIYFKEQMNRINATYGAYAITGNHELSYNNINSVIEMYNDSGVELLINEVVTINGALRIFGRNDYYYGGNYRSSIDYLSESDVPLIVLDHQPQSYLDSKNANAILQISGHTHNGQLFPADIITSLYTKLLYNSPTNRLHTYDDFSLYITRGYGTWGFPVRTTGSSEIVDIYFHY